MKLHAEQPFWAASERPFAEQRWCADMTDEAISGPAGTRQVVRRGRYPRSWQGNQPVLPAPASCRVW